METLNLPVEKRIDSSRVSWINHGLFKAFMAGLVIGSGISLASAINTLLKEPETMTIDFVTSLGSLIFSIYLTSNIVKNFLSRYGFEGYSNKHGQSITNTQLISAMAGLVIGGTITELHFFILTIIYAYVGDEGFLALLFLALLGIAVTIAIYRRLSQIRKA
ncbi:MAG: hypothetical protein KC443_00990 [Anaerolineales bacterium]|nr:hypothetical protein [Anaerolineales bacterium]